MSKKQVIGFHEETYKSMRAAETEAFGYLAHLENLSKMVMGDDYQIQDYESFLKDPYGYMVAEFKAKFYSHLPGHFDPELAFNRNLNLSQSDFSRLITPFNLCVKALGDHAPKITKEGVSPGVKKEAFNIYLDPAKKDHYEALMTFVNAARVIREKYNGTSPLKLNQFAPGLIFDGNGHSTPNPDLFSA